MLPGFLDNQHTKVVRLSALRTGCLYPQGWSLVLISVRGSVIPRMVGRTKFMENPNDPIRDRTRDLPACSAVASLKTSVTLNIPS